MSFTHLHVHTEYSLLDGMCRINDLLEKTKESGMSSVAITDHGAMYGVFSFYIKAKEMGIKPIIGVEAYKSRNSRFDKQPGIDRDQNHLVLLAKNLTGYKNLMKLVTKANIEGYYYKPRIDFELLEKHHQGLIALSGCLKGELASLLRESQQKEAEKVLKRYLDIFGEDFYLEIQRFEKIKELKGVNEKLLNLSRKFGVPLVATNDVHYLNKDDAYAQEILLCIQSQRTIFEKNRPLSMINNPEYYFKSTNEMKGLFIDLPEAIENTMKIADQCNVEIPYGKWILPNFKTPKKQSPEKYLIELVNKCKKRTREYSRKLVEERLNYELDIINKRGYSTYFLIVQDFVNWAKQKEIAVGPGRGSVAGSLVAFVIGITDINPLDYNLPFERFLNPDRPTPPDIDIDFADVRRDEVLRYVTEKYGRDKVAQIITFGRMEARSAVRDVARALGLSYAQGDRLSKMIPQGKQGFSMTISQALEESSPLKFAYQTEEDTKKVINIAQRVEKLPRHASVHAAGVIISDKPLTEYVPLQKESRDGRIITQYDMYCLDLNAVSNNKGVGLLKVDFLGLRNLTIIEEALKYVSQSIGRKIDIHKVPLDDKKTYQLVCKGNTVGVFQLESAGMRRLAKDLKPSKITDLIAMVALFRPGPMDLIPLFLKGKANPSKIKYIHKDLKSILGETYGVLVYQEQVMEIAHLIGGYTWSEADNLRMAMGKKKKSLMKKEQKKFIDGCLKKGYTKKLAEKIFNFIEKFASYGFNKPHSASYALIAYWTAYIKSNYPVEFLTALLTATLKGLSGSQREIKMAQAIGECKRMKIKILPPDINKSEHDFKIEDVSIRFGLSAIKNVGKAAIESILISRKNKPFHSFRDFLNRVDLRKVNKKTVESLIKAGAFLKFGNRATLLTYYPKAIKEVQEKKIEREKGQFSLFSKGSQDQVLEDIFEEIDEFSEDEICDMEKEIIGYFITKNPLYKFKDIIEKKTTKKIGEITTDEAKNSHIVVGIVSRKKIIKTKKNNSEMAFIQVFDDSGSVEVVVFPKIYEKVKEIINVNQVLIIKGVVTDREGRVSILMNKAMKLG